MAPKQGKGAPDRPRTDGPTWVGKALIRALEKEPALQEPLVHLVQEHAGPGLTLELINSLQEVGLDMKAKVQKKELTEDQKEQRRENLKKAREAKQAKAKGIAA